MQRKLTAILCADVVGYSGLMEADETGTLERLKANRSSIFDPHVASHRGRIFKLMGDGALVEFSSVVAAVNCALAIQVATAQAEQELSDAKRITYRIGINLGEVIVEGDDIYGDGVNVAARLQALAEPGGVALSLVVRDQVVGKVACEFHDLGEHTFKNITRPVHVFALRAAATKTTSAAMMREWTGVYRFGRFELNLSNRQLLADDQPAALGARAFDVLQALFERRDRLVTKEELLGLVWPGLIVEENNLQVQISTLRKLLGKDAISTIPGRGYRFVLGGAIALEDEPAGMSATSGHAPPAERDTFVGRREELRALAEKLSSQTRLLSVVGMGGSGKTRLVSRFGWSALHSLKDRVWFCDLSQARSLEGILYAVANSLGIALGNEDGVLKIGRFIARQRQCLVILDNFEQVVQFAEATLGRWLDIAADARFIVTSREILGLQGEEVMTLAPLESPEAARLFVSRAQSAGSGFEATPDDYPAIDALTVLLEGIPLAIELAAARVRVMSPTAMIDRMSDRFSFLASTRGGRADRHMTLRATFEWSWELLSDPEKATLASLSVFAGGFTLEAVEATVDPSCYSNAPSTMDVLQSLVQKSLVKQIHPDRFDLLVSVQEFAAEKLRALQQERTGGDRSMSIEAEMLHGKFYADLSMRATTGAMCVEVENLVAACRRAVARGDAEVAALTLQGTWACLNRRGPFAVGSDLASRVQSIPGIGGRAAAIANHMAARLLVAFGQKAKAHEQCLISLASQRETGDREAECGDLLNLAQLDMLDGRLDTARAHLNEARAIARELGERTRLCTIECAYGELYIVLCRFDEARQHLEAGLYHAREANDQHFEARTLLILSEACSESGSLDAAASMCATALQLGRKIGDKRVEGRALRTLGWLDWRRHQFADALSRLGDALAIAQDLGHVYLECRTRCDMAGVNIDTGDLSAAATHCKKALELADDLDYPGLRGEVLSHYARIHARRARLIDARACLSQGEALLRAAAARAPLAVLLCNRVEVECLGEDYEAAVNAFQICETLASEICPHPESEFGLALTRAAGHLARE